MEIPGGGGEYYEAPWNGKSWGVGGQALKNPPLGRYGYFLEPHNEIYFRSFSFRILLYPKPFTHEMVLNH